MRKGVGAVAGMLVVVLGAACSSTAQVGAPKDPQASAIRDVAAPKDLQPLDVGSATGKPKNGSPPLSAGRASEPGPSAAEAAFAAAVPPGPPPPSAEALRSADFGPGVTNDVIRIGAVFPEPMTALYNTIYSETYRPDFQRVWKVVVHAVNSTGGIAGRRVEPVFLGPGPTDEQICTYFTEEKPVAAVAGLPLIGSAPCLDRAGIVPISDAYWLEPGFYKQAPHALAPATMSQERATRLYVAGLLQQGFFDGDHKIGLLRWDTPPFPEMSREIVEPMLARHGLRMTKEVVLTDPEGYDGAGVAKALAEARAAVQTFKRAGVDLILTLDSASDILGNFTDYAQEQDYHPRYGVYSFGGGEWEVERKQLKGAVGIGWMPWQDLEPRAAYRSGNDGTRRCKDLMVAAGERQQMDTYNEAIWSSGICDAVLLLKAAVEAGGPSITPDSIVTGAESLGTSFQASNSLATRFGPGRHEGAAAIRFVRWFVGCQCFRYTSDLIDAG